MKIIIGIIVLFAAAGGAMFFLKPCPPAGPWPTPPWCSSAGEKKISLPAGVTDFDLSRPQYPGSRSAFAFPPSCNMIPDVIGKSICEDYKSGYIIFWQEEACGAMPFASGVEMCKKEREELKKVGDKNAPILRKEKGEWWKRPDLHVYVYGDTRLRTEELRPDVSVWGGGNYDGWRADEIFMTHAAGILKITSHSFNYIGENDLDYMRDLVLREEGVSIASPEDLKKPEVVKVKTDFEYLKSKSKVLQSILPAVAKDLDNKDVMVDFTFADGSKRIANLKLNVILPEFKNYLVQYYKWQVDANADGIFIDDLIGLPPAYSFNSSIMEKFGVWLGTQADKSVLAKYNITDPQKFNYREFLRSSGFTKSKIESIAGEHINESEEWRSVPLMLEFRKFLIEENQKALTELVAEVRNYAKARGNTKLVVTGNSGGLSPAGAFSASIFDYLTFEYGFLAKNNPMAYKSVMPIAYLGPAKDKPVANQIVVTNWDPLAHKTDKDLRLDIMRLAIMESYAAGSGTSYVRYALNDPRQKSQNMNDVYAAMDDRFDLVGVQKAYGFMRKNLAVFRDFTRSTAQVAVIFDNNEVIKEWKNKVSGNHQGSVENISRALEEAGIAYEIVNPRQLAELSASRKYKFVVLPKFENIGDDLNTALGKAKEAGVQVVDAASKESAVASMVGSVPVLKLPSKMKAIVKTNGKDVVVHLFNYNYDAGGFKQKKDIPIDMSFFGGVKKVMFSSLEQPEPVALDPVNPKVPAITAYAMILIER